jgi:hypothetical protein
MRRWLASLLALGLLTGCSSYAVPRYGVSVTNVTALKQAGTAPVNVGKFTATGESRKEITCRAVGPIKTPDERPFEEYVLYAESAPVAGCGKFYWTRPGGTLEDFERESSPNATAAAHGDLDYRRYRECLAARGWARGLGGGLTAAAAKGGEDRR